MREENGEEKTFTVSTASLPYLTRPGRLIYKLVGGKTRYDSHHLTGKPVIGGEFSYGVSNAWSLYGGSQLNGYYQALAVGLGRDLFPLALFPLISLSPLLILKIRSDEGALIESTMLNPLMICVRILHLQATVLPIKTTGR